MNPIPFVKREHSELARKMEDEILSLPPEAGVLFVGVTVSPTLIDQDPTYEVYIGCSREMEVSTIESLVHMRLALFLVQGLTIKVEVRRGVALSSS